MSIAIISTLTNKNGKTYYGLDCEWHAFDGTSEFTRTLAISFPGQNVVLFDFTMMGVRQPEDVPQQVKKLLELQTLIPCGRNIGLDLARLCLLGIKIKEWIELCGLALSHDSSLERTTLVYLCERYLNLTIDKFGQTADYSVSPLPPELAKYAALDALISRLVAEVILKQSSLGANNMIIPPDGNNLEVNTMVKLFRYSRAVCRGRIEFVGKRGQTQKWGELTVGEGKVLLCITEVMLDGAKPPFMYFKKAYLGEPEIKWNPETTTLKSIVNGTDPPVIAVHTSSIVVRLENQMQK